MQPNPNPLSLQARVLEAPVLQYGAGSKQPTIVSSTRLFMGITALNNAIAEAARWPVEHVGA